MNATRSGLCLDLSLEHELLGSDSVFSALVAANHKWLGHYARLHATFSVEPSLLERNSIWMNAYFQKHRMLTSPWSTQAKTLLKKHQRTVAERLRSVALLRLHTESEFSTHTAEPVTALMFAATGDRCPEPHLEYLLAEAIDLFESHTLRSHANRSGFAGSVFRLLTQFTDEKKRLLCLELLVRLAADDADAVVQACQVAAQGQLWQPNMFIYTLQRRHRDNDAICSLVAELLKAFADRMPIASPIQLSSSSLRSLHSPHSSAESDAPFPQQRSASSPQKRRTHTLPSLGSPRSPLPPVTAGAAGRSPARTAALHSPTTTMSSLYVDAPSPYAPHLRLPLARPAPASPLEQSRRAQIFSTPKLAAVDGNDAQHLRRCRTPNAADSSRLSHVQLAGLERTGTTSACGVDGSSPPASPSKRVVLSDKTAWTPESLQSVSGFEWWWRSLPPHHASLEPTQKLKMVTKAAVRLHTSGDVQRAIELYQLALTMAINDDVTFRLRINLACAYEAAQELAASAEAFRAALVLQPDDTYAQCKLGEVLGATGAFAEARKLLEGVAATYPQANDALKQLAASEERQRQADDALRDATTKAKLRRSPSKKTANKSVHRGSGDDVTEAKAVVTSDADTSRAAQAVFPRSPRPTTGARRTVSKTTAANSASASCQTDAPECRASKSASTSDNAASMAPAAHSTVSVCSVGTMVDSVVTMSVGSGTDDNNHYSHNASLVNKLVRQKLVLDVAETNALVWIQSGAQRVEDANKSETRATEATLTETIAGASVEAAAANDPIDGNASTSNASTPSNDDKPTESNDGDVDLDAIGSIAPLQHANRLGATDATDAAVSRREHARRATILRREQVRIFARKHLHCRRELQALAVRARKHHAVQCAARAFLVQLASDAVVKCRDTSRSCAVNPKNVVDDKTRKAASSDSQTVNMAIAAASVSQTAYADIATAALARVVLARELTHVQTLARNVAANVQVPSTWKRR